MRACLILTTCSKKTEAHKIAKALLTEKLAACIQISSKIRSLYDWKGRHESASEYQLWIKCTQLKSIKCMKRIEELHSYEVPEILMMKVDTASKKYLRWLQSAC